MHLCRISLLNTMNFTVNIIYPGYLPGGTGILAIWLA